MGGPIRVFTRYYVFKSTLFQDLSQAFDTVTTKSSKQLVQRDFELQPTKVVEQIDCVFHFQCVASTDNYSPPYQKCLK